MDQPATTPQQAPDVGWSGYYINLDRATERRERIERQLRTFGLADRYHRFPAVDGRALNRPSPRGPGEVGIFRSHLDVMTRIAASNRPGHVIEDDVILCDLTAPAIEQAIRRDVLGHFDILFLETYVGESITSIQIYHRAFQHALRYGPIRRAEQLQILDLSAGYQYGTTSYLVTPDGAGRLAAILEGEWARGPTAPIDNFIRDEVRAGRLRVGCVFPFVTAVDLETSWMSEATRGEHLDLAMLQRLIRYTFFVRRDIAGYAVPTLDRVMERLPPPETGEAMDLYVRIVQYLLAAPPESR